MFICCSSINFYFNSNNFSSINFININSICNIISGFLIWVEVYFNNGEFFWCNFFRDELGYEFVLLVGD